MPRYWSLIERARPIRFLTSRSAAGGGQFFLLECVVEENTPVSRRSHHRQFLLRRRSWDDRRRWTKARCKPQLCAVVAVGVQRAECRAVGRLSKMESTVRVIACRDADFGTRLKESRTTAEMTPLCNILQRDQVRAHAPRGLWSGSIPLNTDVCIAIQSAPAGWLTPLIDSSTSCCRSRLLIPKDHRDVVLKEMTALKEVKGADPRTARTDADGNVRSSPAPVRMSKPNSNGPGTLGRSFALAPATKWGL